MVKKTGIKFEIDRNENSISIKVNTRIYPLPIIYQVSDIFIDKAYVFLDGNPEKSVNVMIKPIEDTDLEKLAGEFSNELINYSAYFVRRQINKDLIESMINRAFQATNKDCVNKNVDERTIDIGSKVPLFESVKKDKKNGRKQMNKFNQKEIKKSWKRQKGAIKKEPNDYGN